MQGNVFVYYQNFHAAVKSPCQSFRCYGN